MVTAVVPLSLIPQGDMKILIQRLLLLRQSNKWVHSAMDVIWGDWVGNLASFPPLMLVVSRHPPLC